MRARREPGGDRAGGLLYNRCVQGRQGTGLGSPSFVDVPHIANNENPSSTRTWGYHTADAGPRCGDDVMGDREGSSGRDSTTTKHAFTASDIMTSLTRMEMQTCHKQGSRGRT